VVAKLNSPQQFLKFSVSHNQCWVL